MGRARRLTMKTFEQVARMAAVTAVLGCSGGNGCNPSPPPQQSATADARLAFADAGERHTESNHVTTGVDLPVDLIPQQTSQWCWAASAEMTMAYLGKDVSECAQANAATERDDCCNEQCPDPDESSDCVVAAWPDFEHWGFQPPQRTNATALSWEDLTAELSAGRPFTFTWQWIGGSGHMMVAHGWQIVDGVSKVQVDDPWPPCEGNPVVMDYDEYVARDNDHTHWDDFYGIKLAAPGVLVLHKATSNGNAPAGMSQKVIVGPPGPPKPEVIQHVDAAALSAVTTLAPKFPRELGLPIGTNLTRVKRGAPIKMAMVRLDELQGYKPGIDPSTLIHDTGAYLVPVSLNGQPVSSLIVVQAPTGFKTVAAGYAWLAKAVSAGLPPLPGGPNQQFRLVQIPALHLSFLAYGPDKSLKLRPLAIPPARAVKLRPLMITPGPKGLKEVPSQFKAADAFQRLVPTAKAHSTKSPS